MIWYEDLCKVALQKYMIELGRGNQKCNENQLFLSENADSNWVKEFPNVRGSFILHSNFYEIGIIFTFSGETFVSSATIE